MKNFKSIFLLLLSGLQSCSSDLDLKVSNNERACTPDSSSSFSPACEFKNYISGNFDASKNLGLTAKGGGCGAKTYAVLSEIKNQTEYDGYIARVPLGPKGDFSFHKESLGIDLEANAYKIGIMGCDRYFGRIVSHDQMQDINSASTLLSYAPASQDFSLPPESMAILQETQELLSGAGSEEQAFERILHDRQLAKTFKSLFDSDPEGLAKAPPKILSLFIASAVKSGDSILANCQASHWNKNLKMVYEWHMDDAHAGSGQELDLPTLVSLKGSHTIKLSVRGESSGGNPLVTNERVMEGVIFAEPSGSIETPGLALTGQSENTLEPFLVSNRQVGMTVSYSSAKHCRSLSEVVLTEVRAASDQRTYHRIKVDCDSESLTQDIAYELQTPADGLKTLSLTATDVLGEKTSQSSNALKILLDTTAPTDLSIQHPTGSVNSAAVSSVWTATGADSFDVAIAADAQCLNALESHSGLAVLNQAFSSLSDGSYFFCLSARDEAGNQSKISNPFTIDTQAPSVTVPVLLNGVSRETVVQIVISDADVKAYKFKIGELSTTSCDDEDGYSDELAATSSHAIDFGDLDDGDLIACFVGRDQVGNWQGFAEATSATWKKDTTPPNLSAIDLVGPAADGFIGIADHLLNADIAGNLNADADASSVAYALNSNAADCSSLTATAYHAAFPTADDPILDQEGFYKVCVKLTDAPGNSGHSESQEFYYDPAAPGSFSITAPATLSNNASPVVSWQSAAGAITYDLILGLNADCSNDIQSFQGLSAASQSLQNLTDTEYFICVTAKDAAGNTTQATNIGYAFTVDTALPGTFSLTAPSANLRTNDAEPTVVWDVSSEAVSYRLKVSTGTACPNTVQSFSGVTSASQALEPLNEGTYYLCLSSIDAAGNERLASNSGISFVVDLSPPGNFSINGPSPQINSPNALASWSAASGASSYDIKLASQASCNAPLESHQDVSVTSIGFSNLAAGIYYICLSAKDLAGNIKPASNTGYSFLVDLDKPQLQSISLNNGAATTTLNVVSVDVAASDALSNILKFCLTYNNSVAPGANSDCWVAVDSPLPGLTPATTLGLTDFSYQVGFTPGNYTVYVWVMDAAGNISLTSGNSSATISYSPGTPPSVYDVLATSSNVPDNPLAASDILVPSGADVYVKWHADDAEGWGAAPISLYYTTDEANYVLISASLINGQNGDCDVDAAGTSLDDQATGCFKWVGGSPTSSYFRVQVRATDSSSMTSSASSAPVNTGAFSILSGNTDTGLYSSASSALYVNDYSSTVVGDPHSFALASDGTIYHRDPSLGVLYASPHDGVLRPLLKKTGTTSGNGLLASATARDPLAIALDHQERLLVFDYNVIRRIDTNANPMTIETIIGGGSSTGASVLPLSLQITNPGAISTNQVKQMIFTSLPNGRIYFQSESYYDVFPSAGYRIRVYDPTNNVVDSIVPNGTGHEGDTTTDIASCRFKTVGLAYNTSNSSVVSMQYILEHNASFVGCTAPANSGYMKGGQLDPGTGASLAPHPSNIAAASNSNNYGFFLTGRNGKLYWAGIYSYAIRQYNPATNTWSTIAGTGVLGSCPDNTAALSCAINPSDVFVSATGTVYFIERGRIRMIDSNGKIVSVLGQGLSYGDGGQAISARFKTINDLGVTDDDRVIVIDRNDYRIREFSIGGNIAHVAGNGSNSAANTTQPASGQGIIIAGSGQVFDRFVVDPASGDIFYNRGTNYLAKLTRTTGLWSDVAGGGSTGFFSADGLGGSQIRFYSYYTQPVGFDGQNVLTSAHQYVNPNHLNSYLKLYDSATGAQAHLIGSPANTASNLCADGTAVDSCPMPPTYGTISKAFYDAEDNVWLLAAANSSRIISVSPSGGTVSTFKTLPRSATSFTYRRTADLSTNMIYYCATTNGRLYSYNLNTSTDTALTWPSSLIACTGKALVYSAGRNSLIFPFSLNNLNGVAEYRLP